MKNWFFFNPKKKKARTHFFGVEAAPNPKPVHAKKMWGASPNPTPPPPLRGGKIDVGHEKLFFF